jgi:hypothetical protein
MDANSPLLIPAGQKLCLRHVHVKPAPVFPFPWFLALIGGIIVVVMVLALGAWTIMKKRREAFSPSGPRRQDLVSR